MCVPIAASKAIAQIKPQKGKVSQSNACGTFWGMATHTFKETYKNTDEKVDTRTASNREMKPFLREGAAIVTKGCSIQIQQTT